MWHEWIDASRFEDLLLSRRADLRVEPIAELPSEQHGTHFAPIRDSATGESHLSEEVPHQSRPPQRPGGALALPSPLVPPLPPALPASHPAWRRLRAALWHRRTERTAIVLGSALLLVGVCWAVAACDAAWRRRAGAARIAGMGRDATGGMFGGALVVEAIEQWGDA